jgi:glyoxylase-like metal-dependent hydrolase (beta-lactamase superfamily II)
MIIKVTPRVSLLRPAGKTAYPYSNSIYIEDQINTLIDAGAGGRAYQGIPPGQIDMLLLSHYHFDHVNGVSFFSEADVYSGQEEALVYTSPEQYLEHTGRWRWKELMGQDKSEPLRSRAVFPDDVPVNPGFQFIQLKGCFKDGQVFDLGSTCLQAVHLPGHTWGHYGFYIESEGLLFSGDLDLAPQGPWYGGESSDVEQMIKSIDRILEINPRILVTSHRRVFRAPQDSIVRLMKNYQAVLLEREERIMQVLRVPQTLDDIARASGDFLWDSEYAVFYTKMMTLKHLQYMIRTGRATKLDDGYYIYC